MSALQRVQPDSVWVVGYQITGLDLAGIDQNAFLAINGDFGGTWLPLTPITIAGAGVGITGPWIINGAVAQVTGPIEFNNPADDDAFGLAPGHIGSTQAPWCGFMEVYSTIADQARQQLVSSLSTTFGYIDNLDGVETINRGADRDLFRNIDNPPRFMCPIRVHNKGTITQAQIQFRVEQSHVPTAMPKFRVIAIDQDGNVFPLRAPDGTTDADGFVAYPTPSPLTAANWFMGGAVQSIAYGCNQNNVVDVGRFTYFIEIIDEPYANAATSSVAQTNMYIGAFVTIINVNILDGRA